jgi:virginiamycin A acetyltransferase
MNVFRDLNQYLLKHFQPIFMNMASYYRKYDIGKWTYGNPKVINVGNCANLKIGNFCSFAPGVTIILSAEHRADWVTTFPFPSFFDKVKFTNHVQSKGDIVIENDVWIGADATILSGVTIANGSVIGARSVVSKNVSPYSIVVGNPAKHVRFRFDKTTVDALQEIAWWSWPISKIEKALPFLLSPDVEQFIDRFR